MTVGCSSNSSYAHNDPAHTTRRTEVRLSRVAARAGHDLGHCCCGWARWGLVERESEVAVGSSCPGVKLVEWASKRGASLGVSAADRAGATNERVRRRYLAIVISSLLQRVCYVSCCLWNACTSCPSELLFGLCLSASAELPSRVPHKLAASASAVCHGLAFLHVLQHCKQVCSYSIALRPSDYRNHVFQQLQL